MPNTPVNTDYTFSPYVGHEDIQKVVLVDLNTGEPLDLSVSGSVAWGAISGDILNQVDLQAQFDGYVKKQTDDVLFDFYDTNGFSVTVDNGGYNSSFIDLSDNFGAYLGFNNNQIIIDSNSINLQASSGSSQISIGGNGGAIGIASGGLILSDNRIGAAAVGWEYAADYSANYTNRSLVDKEYVDTLGDGFVKISTGPVLFTYYSGGADGFDITNDGNGGDYTKGSLYMDATSVQLGFDGNRLEFYDEHMTFYAGALEEAYDLPLGDGSGTIALREWVVETTTPTTESPMSALIGGGSAGATLLSSKFNWFETVASDGDSAILPIATVGAERYVSNNTGVNNLYIYPAVGEYFVPVDVAPLGVNAPYHLTPGTTVHFVCTTLGQWKVL